MGQVLQSVLPTTYRILITGNGGSLPKQGRVKRSLPVYLRTISAAETAEHRMVGWEKARESSCCLLKCHAHTSSSSAQAVALRSAYVRDQRLPKFPGFI